MCSVQLYSVFSSALCSLWPVLPLDSYQAAAWDSIMAEAGIFHGWSGNAHFDLCVTCKHYFFVHINPASSLGFLSMPRLLLLLPPVTISA